MHAPHEMTLRQVALRPSAMLPVVMSVAAIALVAAALILGVPREPVGDEGAAAHLWQLLMAGQLPTIAYFAVSWLPRAPREAAIVLAIQFIAALAATAPVFLLHL